ncbi:MAG: glycosyltransferase family 2 protein [Ignavibacteria bacterium]
MPLVSIILPTHNRLELLKKAVSSVYEQSLQDWELMVVYNESSDGTEEYLMDLSTHDKRIHPVRTTKSSFPGISEYLNLGIAVSKGKYIARLDDDDIWSEKEKISLQTEFMEKNNEYVLTGGGQRMVDCNGRIMYEILKTRDDNEIRKKSLISCPFEHTTVIFRKDAAERIGNYKIMPVCEDWELFLNLGTTGKFYNFPLFFTDSLESDLNISLNENSEYQRLIASTEIGIIKSYKYNYPHYRIGLTLHSLQYIYAFVPKFFRNRLKYILRYYKRSI